VTLVAQEAAALACRNDDAVHCDAKVTKTGYHTQSDDVPRRRASGRA